MKRIGNSALNPTRSFCDDDDVEPTKQDTLYSGYFDFYNNKSIMQQRKVKEN